MLTCVPSIVISDTRELAALLNDHVLSKVQSSSGTPRVRDSQQIVMALQAA